MLKRVQLFPRRWKGVAIAFIILAHAIPLLITAPLLLPKDDQVFKNISPDPKLSFIQAKSTLSAEQALGEQNVHPIYKITLHTISQTNKPTSLRRDITLLFQDGLLVKKKFDTEGNTDVITQQAETDNKFNHLYQAISFHYAETENRTYQYKMSYDYLYVSATKYGGIQSFHQPETTQHQNWKEIIDRGLHHQLNFEWTDALKKFEINPDLYYFFPLSQLPIYDGVQEQLPGISPGHSSEVMLKIWNTVYERIMLEDDQKMKGFSLPLILVSKDGTFFTMVYRTADGLYHQWKEPLQEDLK